MIQLLVKIMVVPFAASILLLLMTGTFNTILGEVIIGGIKIIKLPDPDSEGTVPLESTLQNRRSVRYFQDVPISLQSVSQLLWAAQGITSQRGFRTAPSAGALYPLEIYMVVDDVDGLEKGIYRYIPADHKLIFITEGDYCQMLSRAALWQDAINHAPAVFIIAGLQERTTGKYGNRGIHYMYMEAGHAAQNICLQAVALDLGSLTIGAFTDHEIARIMQMKKGEAPLYIIPVGRAK